MRCAPTLHKLDGAPTYLGLPVDRGLNVFSWRAPVEGREGMKKATTDKRNSHLTKDAAAILKDNTGQGISFSQDPQADADKSARVRSASI